MNSLYPEIEPYEDSFLDVGDGQSLHYEQCGNKDGIPVVFIHGGPGGGINESCRRFFDPKKYRIILFSQRGSGKSTPHATLENNNSEKLIADIETLRQHLAVDKWLVFGGSWGSTLSLLYAIHHPEKVEKLILRGIFLGRKSEIDWLYVKGASELYPAEHEDFLAPLSEAERKDIISSYYKQLTSDDEAVRLRAARAWSIWEGTISKLVPAEDIEEKFGDAKFALSFARIECHYFVNNCFLEDEFILNNTDKIKDIPTFIVQGRYDIVCPPISAWQLHKKLPKSELVICQRSGHSSLEDEICDKLIEELNRY